MGMTVKEVFDFLKEYIDRKVGDTTNDLRDLFIEYRTKEVGENIDDVKKVGQNITNIVNVGSNIDDIVSIGNNLDDILNALSSAEQSMLKAEKWANELEDVEVEPGKYSSMHYSIKAAQALVSVEADKNYIESIKTNIEQIQAAVSSDKDDVLAYKNEAKIYRDEANVSANSAATSEANASISENNALTYSNDAKLYRDKAFEWAEKDTEVEAGRYSAKYYANLASQSENNANSYMQLAEQFRNDAEVFMNQAGSSANDALQKYYDAEAAKMTAQSYANEPEDTYVKIYSSNGDGTYSYTNSNEYSALHWKNKVQAIANMDLGIADLNDTDVVSVQDGDFLIYDTASSKWKNRQIDIVSNVELNNALSLKEDISNKVSSFQSTPDDDHYPTEKLVKDQLDLKADIQYVDDQLALKANASNVYSRSTIDSKLDLKEDVSNKVSSFQDVPDDMHYPTEKLVKDSLDLKADKSDTYTKNEIDSSLSNKADISLENVSDLIVLNKIKNVDGNGSGLDADLLDGKNAYEFSLAGHLHDDRYYVKSYIDDKFNQIWDWQSFYVDAINGNDANDGSSSNRIRTIEEAIKRIPIGGAALIYLTKNQTHVINNLIDCSGKTIKIMTEDMWNILDSEYAKITLEYQDATNNFTFGFRNNFNFVGFYGVQLETPAISNPNNPVGWTSGFFGSDMVGGEILLYKTTLMINDIPFVNLSIGSNIFTHIHMFISTIIKNSGVLLNISGGASVVAVTASSSSFQLQDGTAINLIDLIAGIIKDSNGIPRNVMSNYIL